MSTIKFADICAGNVADIEQWPEDTPVCIVMLFERLVRQAIRRDASRLEDIEDVDARLARQTDRE